MTDTNVSELRPSPAKGEGSTELRPRAVKDRTAAERKRRSRARKRNHRDSAGGHAVTLPPVTAASSENVARHAVTASQHHFRGNQKAIDIAAYFSAVTLAGCAAWFSIKGMVVLFPGAPTAVVAMAVAMETAKLVTAGWLASRWRATTWVTRLALMALVAGLAVINATGVYAQLVSAHVGERGAAAAAIETQDAELAGRIEVAAHAVADLDTRVAQIDSAIAEATRRGRTNTALAAMEGQRRTRAGLMDERNREAGTLAALKAERASVVAKGRQAETEAAPIRYVAAIFGVTDAETAIRWLIALIVLCCDPLANRADGRGFGSTINHRLKPHLVRSTFDSCRAEVIEDLSRLGAMTGPSLKSTQWSLGANRSTFATHASVACGSGLVPRWPTGFFAM